MPEQINKVCGFVLAGGRSLRMGTDKGLMKFASLNMVEHVINKLKGHVDQLCIISNDDRYQSFGFPVYKDIIGFKGPMGGIFTGLFYSGCEKNIFISCDTPFIPGQIIELLKDHAHEASVVVPAYRGKIQPLCAMYSRSILHRIRNKIFSGSLKLKDFIKEEHFLQLESQNMFEVDESSFFNVNTKADYDQALLLLQ